MLSAVDSDGQVLDLLVQPRRDKVAVKLMHKLTAAWVGARKNGLTCKLYRASRAIRHARRHRRVHRSAGRAAR